MSVEALEYSTPSFPSLKQLDVLIQPDLGGRFEPDFVLADTMIITRPPDRNLPSVESQKPHLEGASDLVYNKGLIEGGWNTKLEMARLIRHINTGTVESSAKELEVNIRSYNAEIIRQEVVLPHLNRLVLKDGTLRILSNNGEPVVDAVSSQERNGSVLQVSQAIEKFLITAPNNSLAVLMSPAGWNGFRDEYGQEAQPHLNSQTMIFWKDQAGLLKGLTLVSDLSIEQAQQVVISLGVARESLTGRDERERLCSIVRNPALLAFPGSRITPFEYVLDKMLAVRGRGDFRLLQPDGSVEIRSVQHVRENIRRFDELLSFGMEEERLISEPRQFILANAVDLGDRSIQQEIVRKIENAVLMLARRYLVHDKTPPRWALTPRRWVEQENIIDDFAPEIMFLRSRAGCPPRMGSVRSLRGISFGSVVGGSSGGSLEGRGGICSECGMSNLDNHYHCPECPRKFADETNVAPENRTKQCSCGFKFGC